MHACIYMHVYRGEQDMMAVTEDEEKEGADDVCVLLYGLFELICVAACFRFVAGCFLALMGGTLCIYLKLYVCIQYDTNQLSDLLESTGCIILHANLRLGIQPCHSMGVSKLLAFGLAQLSALLTASHKPIHITVPVRQLVFSGISF